MSGLVALCVVGLAACATTTAQVQADPMTWKERKCQDGIIWLDGNDATRFKAGVEDVVDHCSAEEQNATFARLWRKFERSGELEIARAMVYNIGTPDDVRRIRQAIASKAAAKIAGCTRGTAMLLNDPRAAAHLLRDNCSEAERDRIIAENWKKVEAVDPFAASAMADLAHQPREADRIRRSVFGGKRFKVEVESEVVGKEMKFSSAGSGSTVSTKPPADLLVQFQARLERDFIDFGGSIAKADATPDFTVKVRMRYDMGSGNLMHGLMVATGGRCPIEQGTYEVYASSGDRIVQQARRASADASGCDEVLGEGPRDMMSELYFRHVRKPS